MACDKTLTIHYKGPTTRHLWRTLSIKGYKKAPIRAPLSPSGRLGYVVAEHRVPAVESGSVRLSISVRLGASVRTCNRRPVPAVPGWRAAWVRSLIALVPRDRGVGVVRDRALRQTVVKYACERPEHKWCVEASQAYARRSQGRSHRSHRERSSSASMAAP